MLVIFKWSHYWVSLISFIIAMIKFNTIESKRSRNNGIDINIIINCRRL